MSSPARARARARATNSSPAPSDWDHAKTLISLSFKKDRKKPKLWALKLLLMPALLMLYTIGIFLGYEDSDSGSTAAGDYRLFQGENWAYPGKINVGAYNVSFLDEVSSLLLDGISDVHLLNATTSEGVVEKCRGTIEETASEEICAFLSSDREYALYYGGRETASPTQPALAGAQYAINSALLNASNITNLAPTNQIQRTPQLLTDETVQPNVAVVLIPAIMYVLAATICSLFVAGAIINEKLNGIAKAYLLVGVKMRTYLLQWLAYYSLSGTFLAGLLTLVCVFFKLMPLSNGGLIFISNYLGLVQLYAMIVVSMQLVNEEEMATAIIWLVGLFSMAVGSAILILQSATHVALTVLTTFDPFIGMMQYVGIYTTYDVTGYGTGIHPGLNVASSGLLSNMIAQICGIILWIILTLVYSSPRVRKMLARQTEQIDPSLDDVESEKFEPLSPDKEVVLSLKGVHHTFYPPKFSCKKNAEAVNVLKGLEMEVCRGEVFGFLGHNGAGKSTSVEILSAELGLQSGGVTYHFRDGDACLGDPSGDETIRTKIGVCPQHNDSLQDDLTCRETLLLFAKLKGAFFVKEGQTKEDALHEEVDRRLSDVKFTSDDDCDKPVGTFSGGMKRKVLIAIALLGDPEVVFLDEPTAGLDPYNRRIIWEVIIGAKRGRSIVMSTHYLDEADVLSDRIGILKNGKLVTCGSSLFLKHTLGVGYTLKFTSQDAFDVASFVPGAERSTENTGEQHQWRLNYGTEAQIPTVLLALEENGASGVNLELTTLEEVFLKTGREDFDDETSNSNEDGNGDIELGNQKEEQQARIWDQRATTKPISLLRKLRLVEQFARTNALKMQGAVFLNISMPLIYMVVGLVVVSLVEVPTSGQTVAPPPIQVSSPSVEARFFGVDALQDNAMALLQPVPEPEELDDYFEGDVTVLGGYFERNETLQYAPNVDGFALQVGTSVIANYSVFLGSNTSVNGIATSVQQLPYELDDPFRFDLLFLPMMLSFGFAGLAFTVLDILLLKGNNIVELFRVAGITEWITYLGVASYKMLTTFAPFFTLALILCFALKSVLVGNGGRWLGTILVMLGYAYSGTPIGLILAKKYIHGDFKQTANWFPGVYYTFVALPYIAWSSALQAAPSAEQIILIIGDILCVVPYFAFQRGLGAVIYVSSEYSDPTLSWSDVWSFETRIWYTILLMVVVGSLEWLYLYRLTTRRAPKSTLSEEETCISERPVDADQNVDIHEEQDRSLADNEGINARELSKVFVSEKKVKGGIWGRKREKVTKRAVKGVSFGIRKNEIYTLLGPNGAGKTTVMNVLASQLTPESGEIAIGGNVVKQSDISADHLYSDGSVAFCPQFDALFPKKTVDEHIRFYSSIRGLDWSDQSTQQHLNAIIKLLGLESHRTKEAAELSGGYKRRLCLANAMIGYPKAILADECTTGIDPAARHLVWDVLKPERHDYDVPAILLSSHYMDECQHLGTRIGIMIDGALVATGSLDRLQELYCTGLFVEISLQPSVVDCDKAELRATEAFAEKDLDASVYESLPFSFKLKVQLQQGKETSNITQLAEAFQLLETRREELQIQFYSVALMNLEQIFIDLSRKQFEADDAFDSIRENPAIS